MLKYLHFFQNAVAIFMLVAVVGVSFLATVALSPTVAVSPDSQVAGINESDIVSNFRELRYSTVNTAGDFELQLLRQNRDLTLLSVDVPANTDSSRMDAVLIENPNAANAIVTVTARPQAELSEFVNLYIGDSQNEYRVYGNGIAADRTIEFEVPAKGAIILSVGVEQTLGVSYDSNVTFSFSI